MTWLCGWLFCHLVCLSRYDYHNRVEFDIRWIQKQSQSYEQLAGCQNN